MTPRRPFPMLSPELLAKMAEASFRPPPLMGPPNLGGMGMPSGDAPGFNVGSGLAALGDGLAGWKPAGAPKGMPEDEKLGAAVAGINALQPGPDGKFAPPPMPTDIGSGQGGRGWLDFLTGLWSR